MEEDRSRKLNMDEHEVRNQQLINLATAPECCNGYRKLIRGTLAYKLNGRSEQTCTTNFMVYTTVQRIYEGNRHGLMEFSSYHNKVIHNCRIAKPWL